MAGVLEGLEPKKLWGLFAQIAGIPHGSKNEMMLAAHLHRVAKSMGFAVAQDEAANMCIRVPATKGYEKSSTVVLQGHLDMVCEKNEEVVFDFTKDAVQLRREGDWLRAQGTTLGADNGIGVAAALAVPMSENIVHGPLEILLTVDEETGLTGATRLSPSLVNGHILLNLDSERMGTVCIGCAGGSGVTAHLPLTWEDTPDGVVCLQLKVTGLRGGHSGLDIHENRANALKLMTRCLSALKELGIALADFRGGDKHNAIPRESIAAIALPCEQLPSVHTLISDQLKFFQVEFPHEHSLQILITPTSLLPRVWCERSFDTALNMLMAFPSGALAMSREMPGLVETSTNLATVRIKEGAFTAHSSSRSSLPPALSAAVGQTMAVARLAGAIACLEESYPGWQPNPDSRILHLLEGVHEELFGSRPKREATHAGLECGVIGEKLDGMDMVSIGPDIVNAHSPEEAVNILSVERFWKLLIGVLKRVAEGAY